MSQRNNLVLAAPVSQVTNIIAGEIGNSTTEVICAPTGGGVTKIFCIWNRSYKTMYVFADDKTEALKIAREVGHFRTQYRKWEDCTTGLVQADSEGFLTKALNAGRVGVGRFIDDQGWEIAGQLIT